VSTDLGGYLAVAEETLHQMKNAVPRLDRHHGFMPAGPVQDRAGVVLDLLRQAVTDLDAALQKWDDLDRQQDEYDRAAEMQQWDDDHPDGLSNAEMRSMVEYTSGREPR